MTYGFVKPDPGPSPYLDAPQIQANFAVWGDVFENNHSAMNSRTQGDHTTVIFQQQAAGIDIDQDLDILFCKPAPAAKTGGIQPQLFVKVPGFLPTMNDPNAPQVINPSAMQLTYNTVNISGPQYQSFLPGGYVLYQGSRTSAGVVTLSPPPTTILMAIATSNTLQPGSGPLGNPPWKISTKILSNNSFQIFSNASGSFVITYWAIAIQ